MKVMDELLAPADTLLNPDIEEWKKAGGKTIGYFCTAYVPEELISAAGMLPFRMRATGSTGTEKGDKYAHSTTCSFVRHTFDMALRENYSFLDGLVAPNSCDHIRRMFDAWRRGKMPTPTSPYYLHLFIVPFKYGDGAYDYLRREIVKFQKSLEDHFQVKITKEALQKAIKEANETRRLLKELYQLRKKENPPITGEQAHRIVLASTAMPRDKYNKLLKDLLTDLQGKAGVNGYSARLMLVGGVLDDSDYIKLIEDQGGLVVTDFLCYGTRHFEDLVDEYMEPIEALTKRYLERLSCPRMMDHARRFEYIKNKVQEFKVDGIVCHRLMFCDNWGGESWMLRQDTKEAGIPFLGVEREYRLGAVEQLRTRIQAFLETVGRR